MVRCSSAFLRFVFAIHPHLASGAGFLGKVCTGEMQGALEDDAFVSHTESVCYHSIQADSLMRQRNVIAKETNVDLGFLFLYYIPTRRPSRVRF
jgi:hypothetical protein